MRDHHHTTVPSLTASPPDPAASARRQVTIGVVVSILLHLLLPLLAFGGKVLLTLLAALLQLLLPQALDQKSTPLREIEVTIMPPPAEEQPAPLLPLEANPQRQFLDSRGLAEASEAAKNAIIESDKNMQAASELPASGDLPLPSQDGLSRPTPNFTTQEDTLGSTKQPPLALAQQKPQPMEAAPAEPPPPALYKPQPIPKEALDPVKQQPALDKPLPEPAKMTPPLLPEVAEMNALAQRALEKLKQVTQPDEDDIALSTKPMVTPPQEMTEAPPERPRPVPIPQPKAAATPIPAPPEKMAMLTTPQPRAPSAGYQPQLQKTKIEGNISNRGKAAVDAVSTPLARYKKQVNDAIGSRWYYYIRGKMDLIAAGSVNMSFSIDEKGRPVSVRVESNTSNQSLADVCERAIREAEIEPPPPDLIAPMKDQRLDYSLTFTFYNL